MQLKSTLEKVLARQLNMQWLDNLRTQLQKHIQHAKEKEGSSWALKLAKEIIFEIVLVVVFLKAYNLVRNQFGSQKCTPEYALGHALQIINLERALGIFWEQEIQSMVLGFKGWIRMWNIFYGTAHMAITVFVLGFLFALKPAAYQRCRTIFIIMNILAISGYAGYPLMPPRLVNSCDDPYGGCRKEFTFEDTLDTIGGLWSWKHKSISKVSNHYAAMPSMHAGYSLWCSISMYDHSPYALFRGLAIVYPMLTLYCIVVTANHYFMDAVCGALALLIATKVAPYIPQIGRGSDEQLEAGSGASGTPGKELREYGSSDEKAQLLPLSTSHAALNGSGENHGSKTSDLEEVGSKGSIAITLGTLQKR